MSEPVSPRTVKAEVLHVENLTSRWRRVVIDAQEAQPFLEPHFEREVDGQFRVAFHIGFFFPVRIGDAEDWTRLSGPFVERFLVDGSQYDDPQIDRVTRRVLTVRPVDGSWRHLELNFADHGDGLALGWAKRTEVGDHLLIDMGGRVATVDRFPVVGTYVLLGDETSLPTMATMLERLPAESSAFVCAEVTDDGDHWDLPSPATTTIDWVHRGDAAAGTTDFLIDYCRAFDWPKGDAHLWAAAEGQQIRDLRKVVRGDLGFVPGEYELMGYWRRGVRTEQLIDIEAGAVNGAIEAGEDPFAGLMRLRPAESDQPHRTPYENFDID